MNSVLVIRLPAEATDSVSWLLWSKDQQKPHVGGDLPSTEALTQLSDYQQHPLWVLVPGHQISVRTCTLPKGAAKQTESVLPVLLEDDLAADIDDLHFALLHRSGNEAQVAVVERQKMEQWLTWLAAANLNAQRLLPDWLVLPLSANTISILQLQNDWLVRQHEWQGFTAESELLPSLFEALYRKVECTDTPQNADTESTITDHPTHCDQRVEPQYRVQSYSPLPNPSFAPTLPLIWEYTPLTHGHSALALLAQHALNTDNKHKINLLTGPFAPKHAYQQQWQRWKQVALAASILLSVIFVDRGVQLWQLTRQADQAQLQAENAYRALFPQQKRLVNLRAQLNSVLRQMRGQPVMQGLIPRLRKVAETFIEEQQTTATPTVRFMGMKYDRDRQTLRIQAKAADFAQLEQLRSALSSQFSVEQGQLSREAGQVIGALTIKEKR
ncbi:MAG: type II secretion system protein GspL [Plesiomonas sp.]|uniref:type II secretion system protein GspL n=1 Tax=Plesiomonas sp. TaxID=2486279 RepID=UPI003F2B1EBF